MFDDDAHGRDVQSVAERICLHKGVRFVPFDGFQNAFRVDLIYDVGAFGERDREAAFHEVSMCGAVCGRLVNRTDEAKHSAERTRFRPVENSVQDSGMRERFGKSPAGRDFVTGPRPGMSAPRAGTRAARDLGTRDASESYRETPTSARCAGAAEFRWSRGRRLRRATSRETVARRRGFV
ncbi:MAG: hypothetical protein M3169_07370 [Candidatus Eremiobacteraeota bacterium]|nr:hypothetical protein [Candidatus Eremiobacteraeota bacterium]